MKKPASGPGALFMNCRAAAEAQSRLLDGKLSVWTRIGLRIHIFMCRWCWRYGRQIRKLHDHALKHPEIWHESEGPGLSVEARDRMRKRLREKN